MVEFEVWRPIPGFGDAYEASSLGRVRSKDRIITQGSRWGGVISYFKHGRILRPWLCNSGYQTVYVCLDGKPVAKNVHRLIAIAFHGAGKDGADVNHKNGVKADNRAENLEWCTRSENVVHARDLGLLLDETPIVATPKNGGESIRFRSVNEAARFIGKGRRNIQSAVKGQIPSAYGFHWSAAA